jgi:LasA protease
MTCTHGTKRGRVALTNGIESMRGFPRSGPRFPWTFARLLAVLCFGTLGLLSPAASGAAEPAGRAALERVVVDEMLRQEQTSAEGFVAASQEQTQTNVERLNDAETWAFGSAVILAPEKEGAYPEGWLFVAERTGGAWEVGLEGTPEFAELVRRAPTTVVDEGEKELFTENADFTVQAVDTRLRLPWKRGVKWRLSGGPHGWATGYDRPYSALDFSSRHQGKVRAARRGRVYKMCANNRGWIRVVHRDGYATDYYHLRQNIKPRDGHRIRGGGFLGYTGTDTSCGGAAYGRHVHFALRRNGHYIAVDKKTIGRWTFHEGRAYGGYAKHARVERYPPHGLLRNFGG